MVLFIPNLVAKISVSLFGVKVCLQHQLIFKMQAFGTLRY